MIIWWTCCIHCEVITAIKLINTYLTSHSTFFLVVVRMLRLYSHNPMSLTTVSTMLYLWSPELAHFLPGSVPPVTNSSPSFLLSALTSAPMSSAFFLDSTTVITVFGFLSLAYFHFTQHHPGLSMLLLSGRISGFPSFLCLNFIYFLYHISFIHSPADRHSGHCHCE